MLASTTKSPPSNFEIVRALAGDSTITSDFCCFPSVVFFAILRFCCLNGLQRLQTWGNQVG